MLQIAAAKEQTFSMPEIKEKEERSINVVEVSKAFTGDMFIPYPSIVDIPVQKVLKIRL